MSRVQLNVYVSPKTKRRVERLSVVHDRPMRKIMEGMVGWFSSLSRDKRNKIINHL